MAPPPNDDFANAIALSTTLPASTTGTTVEATMQASEVKVPPWIGLGGTYSIISVWYTFTPSSTGRYRFTARPDPAVIGVSVHKRLAIDVSTASSPSSMTPLPTASDQFSPGSEDFYEDVTAEADLTASTTYRVRISSWQGSGDAADLRTVPFDLEWDLVAAASPPANDDIADADDLGTDPADGLLHTGTTYGATGEAALEIAFDYSPAVWHVFETGASGGGAQEINVFAPEGGPFRPYWEVYEVTTDPPVDSRSLG